MPERFKAKLSSLEDSRNISELALSELINSLQAQMQRRAMLNKGDEQAVEGASFAKRSKCDHCKKYGHEEKKLLTQGETSML